MTIPFVVVHSVHCGRGLVHWPWPESDYNKTRPSRYFKLVVLTFGPPNYWQTCEGSSISFTF